MWKQEQNKCHVIVIAFAVLANFKSVKNGIVKIRKLPVNVIAEKAPGLPMSVNPRLGKDNPSLYYF